MWLVLAEGERWPETLESVQDRRVVWSSLWDSRPDDRIVLDVRPDGDGSLLELTWLAAQPLPGHASPYRYRLNQLLAQELRLTYGQ